MSNFVVSLVFPMFMQQGHRVKETLVWVMLSVFCIITWVVAKVYMVETKGVSEATIFKQLNVKMELLSNVNFKADYRDSNITKNE